ncbi:MAG: phosphatidylglycerol:prolipoprotein diacylglycerol transferase [Polaribacter sp.]|jgi:phosphatidylglycerol:prolipoprotein diacylglycerol transferase
MCPDLSYILYYLIGTQPDNAFSIVKTFGLFLVIAILTAAIMLMTEMRRKEAEGLLTPVKVKAIEGAPASIFELLSNGFLGFALSFKLLYIYSNFAEFQYDPASVILSAKGNWIAGIIGAAIFAGIKYWEKKKVQLPEPREVEVTIHPYERIGDVTIMAAVFGIIGAKIFALAEGFSTMTFQQLVDSFFSGSGLAIYGGLITAFTVIYFYLKAKKITPIHIMDGAAPALMIAYGIGRLGCHFSGDGDWGIPNELVQPGWMAFLPEWMWAYDYPNNVIDSGSSAHANIDGCTWRYCTKLIPKVYPTSIYEFIMASALGGFLWSIRKKVTIPGMLFALYLFFNGFERFWIEKIRINDVYEIFGFQTTQAEFIAVIMMLLGIGSCIFLWMRHRKAVV